MKTNNYLQIRPIYRIIIKEIMSITIRVIIMYITSMGRREEIVHMIVLVKKVLRIVGGMYN